MSSDTGLKQINQCFDAILSGKKAQDAIDPKTRIKLEKDWRAYIEKVLIPAMKKENE